MSKSRVMRDQFGYCLHPDLRNAFRTMLRGSLAVMEGSNSEIFETVAHQMFDPATEVLIGDTSKKRKLKKKAQDAVRNLPGSHPYYMDGDDDEFFLIITTDPDHLAKCLRTCENYKVGQMTPEELEAYKVHQA